MGLACGPEHPPERALIHRVAVNLKPQIAGIADPLNDAGALPHGHVPDIEELHPADIGPGAGL